MKKINKVISAFVAVAISASSAAYAKIDDILDKEFKEEVGYVDDIYKYDLELIGKPEIKPEEEEVVEVLKYERAANIASALGLIKFRSDGFFYEDEVLALDDFCKIAEALLGTSYEYREYSVITHKDALDMIIKALGYDYMDEKGIMSKVYASDILKGLSYNPEKYITRGEMAKLLYNALVTPVMEIESTGKYVEYESSEDNTLLFARFGMEEIEGLVTGADGVSIYANKELGENIVEINRGSYIIDSSVDTTSLLGKRIYGLLDLRETEKVVFLAEDNVNQSTLVPFDAIKDNGKFISWEKGDSKGRINAQAIKYVNLNGKSYLGKDKLSEISSGEGTVLFVASDGVTVDTAVINKYESFLVNRYSPLDEKIYLSDDMLFEGNGYIDVSKHVNPNVCVTLNGKTIKPEDIKAGYIISVLTNGNGYVRIEASDKTAEGLIEEVSDGSEALGNEYLIDEKYYAVSPMYEASKENGAKLPELKLGINSVFLLNAFGHIAYIGDMASEYKYALGKKIFSDEKSLNGSIGVRLFTSGGKWENYYFAKKVTVDGVVKNSVSDIKAALLADRSATEGSIIRYRLNTKKEITFLDTRVSNQEEAKDIESLDEAYTTPSTKLAWNKGKTLPGTKYSIAEDSLIFYLPEDAEDEDEYKVIEQKNLSSGTYVTFTLYNIDDFYTSKLVLYKGAAAKSFPDNSKQLLITRIYNSTNEKGEEIYVIHGLDAISSGTDAGWKEKKYVTTKAIAKEFTDLKAGDLVKRNFDANGKLNALSHITRAADLAKDDYYMYSSLAMENHDDYLIGKIVKIDPNTRQFLIESKSPGGGSVETYPARVRIVAIYDSATKTAQNASLSDVGPGDKIVIYGGWGEVNAVVYR